MNESKGEEVKVFFAWYDMWIGAYWDRDTRTLYICPFPMIVIAIKSSVRGRG